MFYNNIFELFKNYIIEPIIEALRTIAGIEPATIQLKIGFGNIEWFSLNLEAFFYVCLSMALFFGLFCLVYLFIRFFIYITTLGRIK